MVFEHMTYHILLTDPTHYNPAPIRPGTKAQSGSDPAKQGQNPAQSDRNLKIRQNLK